LPFVLAFIGLIPIYLLSAEEKVGLIQNRSGLLESWYKPDSFGLTYVQLMRLKFGMFLIYLLFQWKMLVGFRRNAAAELQKANRSLFIWLSFDTMLKSLIALVVFVSVWLINYADSGSMIQIALVCAELIASAFFLIASPDLLKGVVFNAEPSITGRPIDLIKSGLKPEDMGSSSRYFPLRADKNSSNLNTVADSDQDIMKSIEQFIQLKQPFLDPTFSLKDLAKTLSINTRLVSGAIKAKLGMGFPEYINKVRFGYLENLIERDPLVLDFSIDAMAKMIGFSSRSGFYKAFKNHSNYDSPNQMIENLRRNK
jgi:AraC-like DNA-binding protein